ncbi:MAG: hypothetical protein AAF481_01245 [Acidobacteriota bacterium]
MKTSLSQRRIYIRFLSLVLVAASSTASLFAGGPLQNCRPGEPYRWPDGGRQIPIAVDPGPLGPLSNSEARSQLQTALDTWGAVPSATSFFAVPDELPEDITVDNFATYFGTAAQDGISPVIFDDTGEIFDQLFGEGSGILGFAGSEWFSLADCEILEGFAIFNGRALADGDEALDIMVHEMGHFQNLAHTVVNGQLVLGDTSGPSQVDVFPVPPLGGTIETMYPLYFGPVAGIASPHRDDVASLSTLYPTADFLAGSGAISGRVQGPNGTTPLTGVNVIARNLEDPFGDAVSAISSDATDDFSPGAPEVGKYRLTGLTAGADYALFVDELIAGTFSTPPLSPLPGLEEFYNGDAESTDDATDDRFEFTPLAPPPGATLEGVDIAFNAQPVGTLDLGDDASRQIFLPYEVPFCGERYDSLWINSNGNLTFERASPDGSPSVVELLAGPPRIAALWTDLNPSAGGAVTWEAETHGLRVRYHQVPADSSEAGAQNSFEIWLDRWLGATVLTYGDIAASDGIVGASCGERRTSGFERESNLRRHGGLNLNGLWWEAATFENFETADNDLAGSTLKILPRFAPFRDRFEINDRLNRAQPVHLPFASDRSFSYTDLAPAGEDVDFFRFRTRPDDIVAAEVVRSSLDTRLGLFDADTGERLFQDDDGGDGQLSRLLFSFPTARHLALAVTTGDDPAFEGQGVPRRGARYTLQIAAYRGDPIAAGDDTSTEVPFPAFSFPFAGNSWDSVFVNSNGNLTFGEGSSRRNEGATELLTGPPRIAPLWDDFDARSGLVLAEPVGHHALRIHFLSVPEFASREPNYFTIELRRSGRIAMAWLATARRDALVGFSPGGGAPDPGTTNLSRRRFHRGETVYEVFPRGEGEDFDLFYSWRVFRP